MTTPEADAERGEKAPAAVAAAARIAWTDEEQRPDIASPRIAWDEGDHPARGRGRRRSGGGGGSGGGLHRSASRDSIRSVQSRTQAQTGVPIEFRTLSFRVAESQALSDEERKHAAAAAAGDEAQRETVARFEGTDYHKITAEELYQRLRTAPAQGLSHDAAAKRLVENGHNVLPRQRQNHLRRILGYIFGGFCSILWFGVIIFFICWRPLGDPNPAPYNLGLAILVLIVIFLQACFSAFQDWSTAKTMNSILDMMPSEALVLREGSFTKILTTEVVVGDIVRVKVGDKVPADMRLTAASDVRFDRSALTGESEEVDGLIECTDDNLLESPNIALMGTTVTNGDATGVVIFTGAKAVMGGIAAATSNVKQEPTSIQREITRFIKIIVCLTACLAGLILFAWVGWLRVDHLGYMNDVSMLDDVMGCVVAFIPEGMPVAVALTLLLIAHRMKSANVLPKSLATVEMLGCVNVICSDKTGTLTENKMTVTSVGFVDGLLDAGTANSRFTKAENGGAGEALESLYRAAHLCNEATFDPLTLQNPVSERLTLGNATDGAVLRFAEAGAAGSALRASYPQVAKVPFNSKYKFMLTLHETGAGDDGPPFLALVKGAPNVLLPKSTSYWSAEANEKRPLDDTALEEISGIQTRFSANAERVILLCERHYSPEAALDSNALAPELIEKCVADLTIVGLLGIFDPPRPESAPTVASCRRAGIRFFMMTGDFGLTGAAVARKIGIFSGERAPDTFETVKDRVSGGGSGDDDAISGNPSLLLEGAQISALETPEWDVVCGYEEIVFGRCMPEHKLRIIDELKKRGFATAVTGDGVNDAPALKAADVGIAMVSGSDVALEAADLILLGGFDSIVEAVRLGRLVFQNLQKVISYLLPAGSWSEIWPVLLNVFFGVPLPLSSFLMIIICVFTDLFLSLAIIMEKEEFDLLELPPRRHSRDHLINLKIYAQSYLFIGVMETVCAHAMYFLYYWRHAGIPISSLWFAFESYTDGFYGYTEDQLVQFNVTGQSVYFVTVVLLQWGNILSIRNKRLSILQADPVRPQRRNPWLVLSAVVSLAIAVFVTEEPGLQALFGTGSVPIEHWLFPLPLALGILAMDELRKLAVRQWPKGILARIAW